MKARFPLSTMFKTNECDQETSASAARTCLEDNTEKKVNLDSKISRSQ